MRRVACPWVASRRARVASPAAWADAACTQAYVAGTPWPAAVASRVAAPSRQASVVAYGHTSLGAQEAGEAEEVLPDLVASTEVGSSSCAVKGDRQLLPWLGRRNYWTMTKNDVEGESESSHSSKHLEHLENPLPVVA